MVFVRNSSRSISPSFILPSTVLPGGVWSPPPRDVPTIEAPKNDKAVVALTQLTLFPFPSPNIKSRLTSSSDELLLDEEESAKLSKRLDQIHHHPTVVVSPPSATTTATLPSLYVSGRMSIPSLPRAVTIGDEELEEGVVGASHGALSSEPLDGPNDESAHDVRLQRKPNDDGDGAPVVVPVTMEEMGNAQQPSSIGIGGLTAQQTILALRQLLLQERKKTRQVQKQLLEEQSAVQEGIDAYSELLLHSERWYQELCSMRSTEGVVDDHGGADQHAVDDETRTEEQEVQQGRLIRVGKKVQRGESESLFSSPFEDTV